MSNAAPDDAEPVLAAGGLVVRPDGRIAVVHRSHHDDWSLPKGKADPGEAPEDTARREVEEETGMRCRLGPELEIVRYRDHRGRDKVVRYWLMETIGEPEFVANEEVDELRWCDPVDADALLTYAADRALVASIFRQAAGDDTMRSDS